ncbi:hypothetical protein GCM10027176_55490 [Actinoallomurus bryophytorum]
MTISAAHSRDDGFSADGSRVGRVPDGLRLEVRGEIPGLPHRRQKGIQGGGKGLSGIRLPP